MSNVNPYNQMSDDELHNQMIAAARADPNFEGQLRSQGVYTPEFQAKVDAQKQALTQEHGLGADLHPGMTASTLYGAGEAADKVVTAVKQMFTSDPDQLAKIRDDYKEREQQANKLDPTGRFIGNLLPWMAPGLGEVGGAVRAGEGMLATAGKLAANGGIMGAAQGALTPTVSPTDSRLQNTLMGAGIGAVAGPVLGAAIGGAGRLVRAATGSTENPELASAVDFANKTKTPLPTADTLQSQDNSMMGMLSRFTSNIPFIGNNSQRYQINSKLRDFANQFGNDAMSGAGVAGDDLATKLEAISNSDSPYATKAAKALTRLSNSKSESDVVLNSMAGTDIAKQHDFHQQYNDIQNQVDAGARAQGLDQAATHIDDMRAVQALRQLSPEDVRALPADVLERMKANSNNPMWAAKDPDIYGAPDNSQAVGTRLYGQDVPSSTSSQAIRPEDMNYTGDNIKNLKSFIKNHLDNKDALPATTVTALTKINKALGQDQEDLVSRFAGPDAANQLKSVNADFGQWSATKDKSGMAKLLLNANESRLMKMSANPDTTDIQALKGVYQSLDNNGQQAWTRQILKSAYNNATDGLPSHQINIDSYVAQLDKYHKVLSEGGFVSDKDLSVLGGLKNYLKFAQTGSKIKTNDGNIHTAMQYMGNAMGLGGLYVAGGAPAALTMGLVTAGINRIGNTAQGRRVLAQMATDKGMNAETFQNLTDLLRTATVTEATQPNKVKMEK